MTGLSSGRFPAEVTAVEGCGCGGVTMHRTACTIWVLPAEQREMAIDDTQARMGRYLAALNKELRQREAAAEGEISG